MTPQQLHNAFLYFLYIVRRKESRFVSLKPISILWVLTYDCQKECLHCDCKNRFNNENRLLSLDEIQKIITSFGKVGIPTASLTGGETLLYQFLPQILKSFKKEKMLVNINTNGLLLSDVWDKYRDVVYSYSIGMNALNNSEKKRLIHFLNKIKNEKKRPKIKLRFVITHKNYKKVFKEYHWYKTISDKISLQPMHPKMTKNDYHNGDRHKLLTYNDTKEIKVLMKNQKIRDRTLEAFISYKLYNEPVKCHAGVFTLTVDPYGNIYNCNHLKQILGKISEQDSFCDILKKMTHYRQNIYLKKASDCQCFTNDRMLDYYFSHVN